MSDCGVIDFVALPMRRVPSILFLALTVALVPTGAFASDFWDNRPMRIEQTTEASFPPMLAAEGVTAGQVRAVLNVDADGKFIDCLVTGYTRPEFATALLAVVPHWRYEPARQRGEPVGARVEVVFAFQARGMVVSLTPNNSVGIATNRITRPEWTSLLCRPTELDEPVRAVHVVPPQHPGSRLALRSGEPTVTLDFYIDTEGRTRMPVVLRATHDLYALAALEALLQWRFTPPLCQGRPVVVRATQVFSFIERSENPPSTRAEIPAPSGSSHETASGSGQGAMSSTLSMRRATSVR